MNLRVKRSIFLSVAVLGFTVGAGVQYAQGTSAKTYAKIASNDKLTIPESSRNVSFTGKKALYTKVGTLKGARVVATKSTLRGLAISSDSRSNVRAYRVAVTSRGSVYYKVVTFDGMYRGWIYSGKSTGYFGGGLKRYSTFINQGMSALSADQQNAMYRIATPGTRNDGKSVTYKAPSWTQYKVGRAITDSSMYANTNFRINQVGIRTRENDQWVHIYDPSNVNSPATGWILFSGLSQVQTSTASVKINLVDSANPAKVISSFAFSPIGAKTGSTVGMNTDGKWTISSADQTTILNNIKTALKGSNYALDTLSPAELTQLAQTTYGSSINIPVNPVSGIADNVLRINLLDSDGKVVKTIDWPKSGASKGATVGTVDASNTTWSLKSDDQNEIQDLINKQLTNTNYQLESGKLSQAQITKIAQSKFGSEVSINLSAIPAASVVTPVGGNQRTPFVGTTEPYCTGIVSFRLPNDDTIIKMNATEFHDQKPDDKDSVVYKIKQITGQDQKNAIKYVNSAFSIQAEQEYKSSGLKLDDFIGSKGISYKAHDLLEYLNENKLTTLESPKYPVLSIDGKEIHVDYKNITFTVDQPLVQDGKFGEPADVYYDLKDTKANTD
ncbi:S-layer family protein [Lentilactobacillus parabuchneri]|jgi:hypothetical protein|uniref:S-layer family protein n=1 Tax=Lentilactobacillus parabuchneri TaxID=152331 RepID=UPI000A25637E|nr:S-layer family protein [Lentilactobacillus parabuchneri]ORM97490.1 S-layer protein precursor [Lentilactobacillus parabuchneri]ORN16931.1 S-layer protein precursor [Lentilactobacillus parabuchneri]ORN18729.1 S-layer protein precursor [Lentilactobacillus parabuchneri]ORN21932.1 S-layer protein precursor [Lentilactobacillus parabuchneri]ORN29209.1 S-layer protein precursor [Lentilactobacillus parabuchneri]